MDRASALDQLPTAYAAALRLNDRGTPDAEIAEILGISPEGVQTHLQLAEAKLARLLAPEQEAAP